MLWAFVIAFSCSGLSQVCKSSIGWNGEIHGNVV
jgi:hypothetical protein